MRFQIVLEKYRKYGLKRAALFTCHVLLNRILYFNVLKGVYLQCEEPVDAEPPHMDNDVEICFLSRQQLLEVSDPRRHEMRPDFIEESIRRGDRCMAVLCGGRLASYAWFSNLPTPMNEDIVLHSKNDFIYTYKNFTDPEFRGRRLHGLLIRAAVNTYTKAGYSGVIAAIEHTNFSSLTSFTRLGGKEFGKIFMVRLLGRYFTLCSPGCQDYEFIATSVPRADGRVAMAWK